MFTITWWDFIPLPFFILAIRAMYFRRKIGEIKSSIAEGWMTLYFLSYMVINVIRHRTGYAVLDAGFAAWWGWMWWNSGGGDGIKKFIQSLSMKPAYSVK
jgi:hypothetical protein